MGKAMAFLNAKATQPSKLHVTAHPNACLLYTSDAADE